MSGVQTKQLLYAKDVIDLLSHLPDTTTDLVLANLNIAELPDLLRFKNLYSLDVRGNKLKRLPALNASLRFLDCSENELTFLPPLPENLLSIDCAFNKLKYLPLLPGRLVEISCDDNIYEKQ